MIVSIVLSLLSFMVFIMGAPPSPPCPADFVEINGTCYSRSCIRYGPGKTYEMKDVCSGKGTCTENTASSGKYYCVCNNGTTAYGPYCSYESCMQEVEYLGETVKVECGFSPFHGTCDGTGANATCTCPNGTKKVGTSICAGLSCFAPSSETYCGGDLKAACTYNPKSGSICSCSSDYQLLGASSYNCQPKACIIKEYGSSLTDVCGKRGTCSYNATASKYECTCDTDYVAVDVVDSSKETKSTCVHTNCVTEVDGVKQICSGLGRCRGDRCACGFFAIYNATTRACVSRLCYVNITDDSISTVDPVCGGPAVATCVRMGTNDTALAYGCRCVNPTPTGYQQVGNQCVPTSCVRQMTINGTSTSVSCDGDIFLSRCFFSSNAANSVCKCNAATSVMLDNGSCAVKTCVQLDRTPLTVCNGHGTCMKRSGSYACACEKGFQTIFHPTPILCISSQCISLISSSPVRKYSICGGKGTCTGNNGTTCVCKNSFTGPKCEECLPGHRKVGSVCLLDQCPQDRDCGSDPVFGGDCKFVHSKFVCVCRTPDIAPNPVTNKCERPECLWNDPFDKKWKVCYNKGTCVTDSQNVSKCVCEDGTMSTSVLPFVCVYKGCISEDSMDLVCEGIGVCVKKPSGGGMCLCDQTRYKTDDASGLCHPISCFTQNSSLVCNGHGFCDQINGTCTCDTGFQLMGQDLCVSDDCINNGMVCGGRGTCVPSETRFTCSCSDGYQFADRSCYPSACVTNGTVCNGGGTCSGTTPESTCTCQDGWVLKGGTCYPKACSSDSSNSPCNGNGVCSISKQECICSPGYETFNDQLCISSSCIATDGVNRQMCGGSGKCISENGRNPECLCNDGFSLVQPFMCGTSKNRSSSSAQVGLISFAIIALIVLLAVAGFLVWWFVARRRGKKIGPFRYAKTASQKLEQSGSMYDSVGPSTMSQQSRRRKRTTRKRSGSFLLEAPDDGSVGLLDT